MNEAAEKSTVTPDLTLGYQGQIFVGDLSRWIVPLLLCSPGICCWVLFFFGGPIEEGIRGLGYPIKSPGAWEWLLCFWALAIPTSLFSVVYYPFVRPRPRTYSLPVKFNLLVNASGLLFSGPFAIQIAISVLGF